MAPPNAPDELSTLRTVGETFSSKITAPSAPTMGSRRATARISEIASSMAVIAAFDPRQPKAERRRRLRNRHGDGLALFADLVVKVAVRWETGRWCRRGAGEGRWDCLLIGRAFEG